MQNDPMTPHIRHRRSDRAAASPDQPAAQPGQVQPGQIVQQILPVQPVYPAQPMQSMPQVQPVQPMHPQQPVQPYVYPQPTPTRQAAPQPCPPQQPAPRVYPQNHSVQQGAPLPYRQQPAPQSSAASPTPRALQAQRQAVQSGWQTPTQYPDTVQRTPRPTARSGSRPQAQARSSRERTHLDAPTESAPRKAAKSGKLPAWLVTALALMLIAAMGLFAAQNLMQAYLVTQANQRQAAYQATLDNYHITEQQNGTRRITWQDEIERYAAENNLQPAFVAAIIRNESSFRTNAESSVGARGLMQLMPDTAEWIAGKLHDDTYSFDRLWDAETNIRYGCWYLGYLSELFRGDPVLVCAAYHAGQGDVRRWLGDRSVSPDGLTVPLDRVPIAETKQYAGRVTQAYGIYQTLLYTNDPQLPMYAADGNTASAVR